MRKIHFNFIFTLIFLVFGFIELEGQVVLNGYVTDVKTGERLIGATIYNPLTKQGVATNAFGFFSISLKKNRETELQCSFVGYSPISRWINLKNDSTLIFELFPGKELGEVTITRSAMQNSRSEMGTTIMPMKEIKQLPALGGEADMMKAIQLLPGFKSGGEGSSGLYVRGGSPDQNLVMIDDVPLYYVNHLGGFVSIFNSDIISDVKLVKGSFPARYGSRLSSIVDVRMKDGNMKKREVNGSLGLVTTKLSIEGPIKIDTSSYLVSVRRFMYDLFMIPVTKLIMDGGWMGYSFFDVNGKYNHIFSSSDRLYLSFYMGEDESSMGYENKEVVSKMQHSTRWGNIAGSIRWNHVYNPTLFSNITASFTRYNYSINENNESDSINGSPSYTNRYNFHSGISDFLMKADFIQNVAPYYELRYGTGGTSHNFQPAKTSIEREFSGLKSDTLYGFNQLNAFEGFAYVENILRLGKAFDANIGGRYSLYRVKNSWFNHFEPRLTISTQLGNGYCLKAGYTQMNQFVHLLSSDGMGIPADFWVPATDTLPPSRAVQYGLAFEREDPFGDYHWSIEPYYKTLNNLITFKEGFSNLYSDINWQEVVEHNGRGESYGVEVFFRKMNGKNIGWIGYTLAWTTRQFENINSGKTYPFKYDRRHDISIVFNRKIRENIDFSATWVFSTGNAFTLATARHWIIDDRGRLVTAEVYGEKNGYRMKPYHRLDIGVNFHKKTHWGERTWSFSIYNLYNRLNPSFYYWENETSENRMGPTSLSPQKLYQFSYFPIMPSVSYNFKF